jgi:endoglucanase
MSTLELIERLVAVPGPSGFEDAVAQAISKEIDPLGGVVSTDAIGNLVLRLPANPGAPSLMIMAHMDEVGLLVKYVDSQGFVYCEANGLVDERTLLATQVDIWTDQGPRLGVVGVKSRHLLTEAELRAPLQMNDLWIDIGATSAEEAEALGVEIGLPVTFHPTAHRLSEHVLASKSIDNRAGCSALIEVGRQAIGLKRDYELIFVWSTQEEIGSRGARVAAQWIQPTIAVVVDTLPANDPSTPLRHATSTVGGGPVVRAQDARAGIGTIYAVSIKRRLIETARRHAIPRQIDVFPTWTDACGVHLAGRGVPTGGVYIPRRCSHSPNEIIDVRDVEKTIELLTAFVVEMDADTISTLARRPSHPLKYKEASE